MKTDLSNDVARNRDEEAGSGMAANEATETTKRKRGRPKAGTTTPTSSRNRGRPGPDQPTVGPDALIEMTLTLLSTHAPSEITRASLARFANVDPGLIRYYFNDRDSLMRTAAEMLTAQLQRRGAAASERPELSPPDRISERAKALLNFKIQNPFYHRLIMEEMGRSDDEASIKLFNDIAANAIKRYQGYIEAGVDDGSLRQVDPRFLYMAIIGLCDFFVIASPLLADQLGERTPEETRDAYGDFIADLLLNGLRPR